MSFSVVIPARMASSRLPGKPLADIHGKPMIQWVWEQASGSAAAQVIVACDDETVAQRAAGFGADVQLTSPDHASGTDRLAEVARVRGWTADHIVVNVQGDEPLLPPAVINQVATNLQAHGEASAATLMEPLTERGDVDNPNIVKVVCDVHGLALYFSRAPVPWAREAFAVRAAALPAFGGWHRHIGIYAYRADLLQRFTAWPPAPLEEIEMLEQLRVLHHGERIHAALSVAPVPGGVDTPADLDRVRQVLA